MTEEKLEKANSLYAEKNRIKDRLKALRKLAANDYEDKFMFTVKQGVEQFTIFLTVGDIDVLIDHEEMMLAENDRKFKEL